MHHVAIVKLSARYHAKITKTLHFLVVRLSGFTVPVSPRVVLLYSQLVVTEDNAGELSGAMNGVTADSSKIGGTTLDLGAKVVSNIVDVRTSDHKVGDLVF